MIADQSHRLSPESIEDDQQLSSSAHTPRYPEISSFTPPHSHSIVLGDHNALISHRKFFCAGRRAVSPIRQEFPPLIPNSNFADLRFARFQQLLTSIDRFFGILRNTAFTGSTEKRPSWRVSAKQSIPFPGLADGLLSKVLTR